VVQRVESALAGRGRVYIRYSGTEALARVMVEGKELAQVESYASEIADAVRAALGAGPTPSKETAAIAPAPLAARV
jgi:phosphoglucosamine mutase